MNNEQKKNDIPIWRMALVVTMVFCIITTTLFGIQIRSMAEAYAELAAQVYILYSAQTENQIVAQPTEPIVEEPSVPVEPTAVVEEEPLETVLTNEEIELIALVTMAEAEGEPEEGKRLVIDTILNRMDGKYWPDTVTDVIYQPSQFEAMWNGRVDRCSVQEDICELVREELVSRTNYDVVYFRTKRYSSYGTPLFQVGNHYFSSI